jgi:hypothetical protein
MRERTVPSLAAGLLPEQVRGDSQQPRTGGRKVIAVATAVRERKRERLRGQIIGDVRARPQPWLGGGESHRYVLVISPVAGSRARPDF